MRTSGELPVSQVAVMLGRKVFEPPERCGNRHRHQGSFRGIDVTGQRTYTHFNPTSSRVICKEAQVISSTNYSVDCESTRI